MMSAQRAQLDCAFAEVDAVFEDCLAAAQQRLTPAGLQAYLESGRYLGKMGRGAGPLLAFLQCWPQTASSVGEAALPAVMEAVRAINKSPNGRAIAPFFHSLPAVARRLPAPDALQQYLELGLLVLEQTSGSVHGIHKTFASPCLIAFFEQAAQVLQWLCLEGMRHWAHYGIRHYSQQPEQQRQYFALQSSDSRAVLQRERRGTLLVDQLRKLDLYLLALWQDPAQLVPYSSAPVATSGEQGSVVPLQPYCDALGLRLPDVYEDTPLVSGLERYRAALAHMAAHRRWSTAIYADNFSPAQRLAIECFEDARVDALCLRRYPGLRPVLLALMPAPAEDACNEQTHAGLRHRLAMLARALLCGAVGPWPAQDHGYTDALLLENAARFHAVLADREASTQQMAQLAIAWLAKTRRQSDQQAATWFADGTLDYRDDNRHLWKFHELSDDEESFDTPRQSVETQQLTSLPPRHYPEWDFQSQSYRPDWVSLYESLHPAGTASHIDQLLDKHSALAQRLKKMLELLKPHERVRLRHQEDGSELDLDVALRAYSDLHAGSQPDARITQSYRSNGRSVAVTLLLDLSESLNDSVPGGQQSVLELSQEAVALLAWTVEQLGDPLAIAGFHSNTRHDVRYLHLKGFGEHWGEEVKSRMAAMQAGYSTRMGAAMRHAAHTLARQKTDTRLLLVLTDGRPADVDVADETLLVQDARQAVKELAAVGITSYCINLDAAADAYVRDIFGKQYTVVDRIASLPEKLPRLFMRLTR
jgi:uncharacterized protein YegL